MTTALAANRFKAALGDITRSCPGLPAAIGQDRAGRPPAALPGDRFPNLVAVADEFAKTDWDERFELLIRIFIDGLARQAGLS